MNDADIRSAFASDAEPADEGFTQRVTARVTAAESRRRTQWMFMAIGAAASFVTLLAGLRQLQPPLMLIAWEPWFAFSPAGVDVVSALAPMAAFLLLLAAVFPLTRSTI